MYIYYVLVDPDELTGIELWLLEFVAGIASDCTFMFPLHNNLDGLYRVKQA